MKRVLLAVAITAGLNALEIPSSIYNNKVEITPESSYEIYKIISEGKMLFEKGKYSDASRYFIKALQQAKHPKGEKNIDQYDYLYANYALLRLLASNKDDSYKYKKLAKSVISYLDKITNNGKDIYEEGELGQFQLKMYRSVADYYAKLLYKESGRKDEKLLKEALKYAKKAQKYIRDDKDFYIKETVAMIQNAIDGNPPLKGEKEVEIIKVIKKDTNITKKAL